MKETSGGGESVATRRRAYYGVVRLSVVFDILWTEDSESHIARHGITPGEVEDAIYSRSRWVAPGREDTRLVFAQSSAGRFLLVVLADALDGRDYVVTARNMTDTERRAFTEKGR